MESASESAIQSFDMSTAKESTAIVQESKMTSSQSYASKMIKKEQLQSISTSGSIDAIENVMSAIKLCDEGMVENRKLESVGSLKEDNIDTSKTSIAAIVDKTTGEVASSIELESSKKVGVLSSSEASSSSSVSTVSSVMKAASSAVSASSATSVMRTQQEMVDFGSQTILSSSSSSTFASSKSTEKVVQSRTTAAIERRVINDTEL